MFSFVGRLAVALSVFLGVSTAATVVDSRDLRKYETIASGKYNWFADNLKYSKSAAYTDKSKTSFFPREEWEKVCPEGTRLPSVEEWNDIIRDRFMGPRKTPNIRSFAGKTRGFYNSTDKKKKISGKDAAYFAIAGTENMAVMLDLKRGNARIVKMSPTALVPIRCISERDFYAEKNISKKDMVMTDPRDGKKYKVEQRDNKVWMKSNLKFSLQNVKQCFLEDTLFCKKHGRFFTYAEAKKACPKGWHLPDDGEWRDYQRDRAKLDWNNLGVGGCKDWDEYCDEANTGHYWSATSVTKNTGRSWEFRRQAKSINRTDESVQKGLYVRCVTDLE